MIIFFLYAGTVLYVNINGSPASQAGLQGVYWGSSKLYLLYLFFALMSGNHSCRKVLPWLAATFQKKKQISLTQIAVSSFPYHPF